MDTSAFWRSTTRWVVLVTAVVLGGCAHQPTTERSRVLLQEGSVQIDVIVDGKGPALVLLPSSQRDSEDYDELASKLATEGFKVLRPQPRGMGKSRGPMEGLTLHTLAGDVALTIDKLGEGRAVIVGHAYGHFVARVTDLDHPSKVRGVVVLGAAAKTFPKGLLEALDLAANPEKPKAARLEALEFSMFAPGNDASHWLEGWHPALARSYRLAGQTPKKDVWWSVTNAPILDLQGAQDRWRPSSTRYELKERLGDKVTVTVIDKAGHAMVPEQPQAISDAISAWVRKLAP